VKYKVSISLDELGNVHGVGGKAKKYGKEIYQIDKTDMLPTMMILFDQTDIWL
jgi:hypothetical protein